MGWPYRERLAPGADPSRVVEELTSAGLPAPSEVVEWFGWHDGIIGTDRTTFGPTTLVPLSLREALDERGRWLALVQDLVDDGHPDFPCLGDPDWWWDPLWLPLAGYDSWMVADLGTSTVVAPVRLGRPGDGGGPEEDPYTSGFRRVVAPSLAQAIRECRRLLAAYMWWNPDANGWDLDYSSVPLEDRGSFLR